MKEELLKGLTEEQIAKVKACKNKEEFLALAKEEDVDLTDEQLEVVSGGVCTSSPAIPPCPQCGGNNVYSRTFGGFYYYTCFDCTPSYVFKGPPAK